MTKSRLTTTTVILSLTAAVGTPALGAITARIPKADFDVLGGKVSDSIDVTVIDNGVSADLTFTFTAQAPGHSGSPALAMTEGTRLGITSSFNQGKNGSNSINEGETLLLDVSASVTGVPSGLSVTALDFGIIKVDMVRAAPSRGRARYVWNSSAGSFTSPFTNKTSDQNVEELDGTDTFDIFGVDYSGTFTVDEGGDNNVSGFRWRTDLDNVEFSFNAVTESAVIPEPSTLLVWSLLAALGIGLGAYRRKR